MKTITQKNRLGDRLARLVDVLRVSGLNRLARSLSTQAFGEFSLMRSLILFLPTLAIWARISRLPLFCA
jgi:hypothetical protein